MTPARPVDSRWTERGGVAPRVNPVQPHSRVSRPRLACAHAAQGRGIGGANMPGVHHAVAGEVRIPVDGLTLQGMLEAPPEASGVVLFAHGSGSGRFSPRNQFVARSLREGRVGTLLFDLLTDEEAEDRTNVFDIPLLASRLALAAQWLRARGPRGGRWEGKIGYFGASTGAAAALMAAAADPTVAAVVSRGGRPDLAGEALPHVVAPTLLIVGSRDTEVLELNRRAMDRMRCERRLEVVPGATHLFEEPGALEEVARLSRDWFANWFGAGR